MYVIRCIDPGETQLHPVDLMNVYYIAYGLELAGLVLMAIAAWRGGSSVRSFPRHS